MRFLNSLAISVVGVLRDSQNYVHSAEKGLSIHEMHANRLQLDTERWQPIFDWLEERLDTPLTPRDFRRPEGPAREVHQLAMSLATEKPAAE